MQDAKSEETLYDVVYKDDGIQLLLMQAGFASELVKMNNRHRACQAIILHLVFKTRKEELDQLKPGLESLSLINFLRVSEGCLKYVFPLQSEAMVTKDDFLKVIDQSVESLEGDEKKAYDWFVQYVNEVDKGISSNSGRVKHIISFIPLYNMLMQMTQEIAKKCNNTKAIHNI